MAVFFNSRKGHCLKLRGSRPKVRYWPKIKGLLTQSEVLLELGPLAQQVALCLATPTTPIDMWAHGNNLGLYASISVE